MSDQILRQDRVVRRRPVSPLLLAALSLLLVTVSLAGAQETLREQLGESFQILFLRDGLLFQPLDDQLGVQTIELIGDDLVVDGTSVSLDELEARLGERAAPFRRLLALDEVSRRDRLRGGSPVEIDVTATAVAQDEPQAEAEPDTDTEAEVEAERPTEEDEQREDRRRRQDERVRGRADTQVVVASPLTIEADEVSRDVVVFGGFLTVEGRVIGDAAAVGGSARVSGEIDGDLSAVGGSITLESGAEVRGDVVSVGGEVTREEGAIVHGQVLEVPFGPALRIGDWDWDTGKPWHLDSRPWFSFSPLGYMFGIGWRLFGLAILALLACLVMLMAPKPVELISHKAGDEPWKSGLAGLLSQILFIPVLVIVCLILAISVVGIPLLILVPFALLGLLLVAFLGYTAVAHRLGRFVERRFGWSFESPYVALLVGFVAIQGLGFIGDLLDFGRGPLFFFAAMFGVLGGLVSYIAWTVGFGAALLTRFGTAPTWGEESDWSPPDTSPPSYAESTGWVGDDRPGEIPETLADWDDASDERPPESDQD